MAIYKTVTYEDRKKIEKMYKSGMSMTKIAEAIGKNYSTVYRELQRCPKGQYTADEAQRDVERAKERKKAANKVNSQIRKEKKENEYKSRICACLRINPQANIEDVRKATGIPIEKLTKYYDKLQREVVNK